MYLWATWLLQSLMVMVYFLSKRDWTFLNSLPLVNNFQLSFETPYFVLFGVGPSKPNLLNTNIKFQVVCSWGPVPKIFRRNEEGSEESWR